MYHAQSSIRLMCEREQISYIRIEMGEKKERV